MKIISLNLCGYKNWDIRRQFIISFLNNNADSDIVLFQEVRFDHSIGENSESTFINNLLKYPYSYSSTSISRFYRSSGGQPYKEGLSILSKFPIVSSEEIILTQAPDDKHTRFMLNVDINMNGEIIKITNIHLSNNTHSCEQLKELLDIFNERKENRIIAGDFNIFQLGDFSSLYDKKYKNSFDFENYISFPSENQTLDYFLIPGDYHFESVETVGYVSGHNALIVELS